MTIITIWLAFAAISTVTDQVFGKPSDDNLVLTHIGYLPKQCIHRAQHKDIHLIFTPEGTYETYPKYEYSKSTTKDTKNPKNIDNSHPPTTKFHPKSDSCIKYINSLKKPRNNKNNTNLKYRQNEDWLAFTFSDYTNENIIKVTGDYELPSDTPSNTSYSPILYWAYGLQGTIPNIAQDKGNFLIQPLVTYCGSTSSCTINKTSSKTYVSGYGIIASQCCYNGQLWLGTSYSVPTGSSDISGEVTQTGEDAYVEITHGSDVSSLSMSFDQTPTYDYVCVIGAKPQNVNYGCSNYPNDEFLTKDLYVYDSSNTQVYGTWQEGAFGNCNAHVKYYNPSEMTEIGIYLTNNNIDG